MHLCLYDTERLAIVSDGVEEEYWVLRCQGTSPLITKHKVKKKHHTLAKAIFHAQQGGIIYLNIADMRYKEGKAWTPSEVQKEQTEIIE